MYGLDYPGIWVSFSSAARFFLSYIGSGAQVAFSAGAGRYFLGNKAAGA